MNDAQRALKDGTMRVGDLIVAPINSRIGSRHLLEYGYRATIVLHKGLPYYKVTSSPFLDLTKHRALQARVAIATARQTHVEHRQHRRKRAQRLVYSTLGAIGCTSLFAGFWFDDPNRMTIGGAMLLITLCYIMWCYIQPRS